uniref:Inhibitor of growth protein N-terminal histone-binding domain-containing protein n=1 Tax=Strigamia maritima TaxID=126957 RepID=T1IVE6_STRMM
MATALYLEHYLDSLENLPTELQRNFTLMRDLDHRAQDLLKEIDRLSSEYLKNVRSMPPEKKTNTLEEIQEMFGKTREFGDDKVQLAIQTYELVDKHIRRLDSDLARFEAELKDKALNSQSSDSEKKSKRGKDKDKRKSGRRRTASSDDDNCKSARKKLKSQPQPEVPFAAIPALSITINHHPSDVLDMPVDPNEPTYCLCHQVSYGEMIGCDNPD